MKPTVLTIAGSDPSGGAGIQADLKAIAACGGYGASVITAITAQNTRGVTRADPLAVDLIAAQMDAVFSDLDVAAVKTGMLASEAVIATVADGLVRHHAKRYVCDPVMISKSGHRLLPPSCAQALARQLLPLATLVTPNVYEASVLSGIEVRTPHDAEAAGRRIVAQGAAAVLVKGGHLADPTATDILVTADGVQAFPGERVASPHTHGTGCTYSAAIAALLARGLALAAAIASAKRLMTEAIRRGLAVGHGIGPTDPLYFMTPWEEKAE